MNTTRDERRAGDQDSVALGRAASSPADIVGIADGARVELEATALEGMLTVNRRIHQAIAQGRVIYGLTTGVGDLVTQRLSADDIADVQLNMLRSHACGVGAPLAEREVRAMMAVMLKSLLQGYSGVSPALAALMAEMLNKGVTPWSPAKGSVGYLIATAHIGLAVFGIGKCWYQGALLPAKEALERAGIELRTPGPREGHALVSGTYEITALGCLAVETFQALLPVADAAGAMSLEALKGNTRGYDARLHALRPFHGQQETARILRSLLTDSEILHKYRDFRVQDALSLRCIPQIHGAVRDQLAHCRQMVTTELNSVTDNPVFLLEQDELVVLPGGNGHGAPLALSLDALAIAVAQLSTASQARSDRLTNSHLSGLPAFLIAQGGANSGMMIPPYVAAALAGDNRALAAPASVHTVSTCAGQEDHVSMGVSAARKALEGIENAVDILAIELLCATQALEFHRPLRASRGSETVLAAVRRQVPFRQQDREMAPDMRAVRDLISGGELLRRLTPIVYPVADKDA
ncbi:MULTISPECIES: HAL/PAL/TAL family ammonia-lyase [Brenneria]|uniref:Aromatic amino acid lyase n=1 Tax=Brenneria nigrifluens DSM 30175 = ATCC 13028 TaxID=1121120 RepID=A0A2U1UFJ3_9GAMM|nr:MULTISPECIES: aromatic amino acid ammonia-lyase [Brenneria]EHD19994.1 Histidine ammonia-lyase [Brenneria sp. EniD312]PWC20387.1 aromatic amino acid lyase [Brenneria nigrifluens DSM 30175 = ATCC 13028]QCR03233.1 aromatic amino acid lyase [Brenneria nigrifluens DSM 30175 = ATCC 13028]